ncbi:uncharacterized protein LOC132660089 [Ovis aries]|uniref:uncharacterized protein LOC132660089 n=1 Tax=Ovis aries TaxID=9940 RepID=UPI00295282D5|nr:uncharacterized protein LOC132660089 [Ovis aries]
MSRRSWPWTRGGSLVGVGGAGSQSRPSVLWVWGLRLETETDRVHTVGPEDIWSFTGGAPEDDASHQVAFLPNTLNVSPGLGDKREVLSWKRPGVLPPGPVQPPRATPQGPPPTGPAFGLLLANRVLPGSSGRDEEGRRGGQALMPPQPHVPHSHQTPPQHHTRGSDPDFGGSHAHSKVHGPKEWRSLVPHFETSNLTTLVSRIQGRVQFCFRICRTSRKRQQCTAAGHGHWPCPARHLYASSTCDSNCRGGAQQTFLKRNTQLKKTAQAGQWGTHTHRNTHTHTGCTHTNTRTHTQGIYTHTHTHILSAQLLP